MAVDGANPAPTTTAAASTGRGDHVHAPIRTSRLGLPHPREGSPLDWSREGHEPGPAIWLHSSGRETAGCGRLKGRSSGDLAGSGGVRRGARRREGGDRRRETWGWGSWESTGSSREEIKGNEIMTSLRNAGERGGLWGKAGRRWGVMMEVVASWSFPTAFWHGLVKNGEGT